MNGAFTNRISVCIAANRQCLPIIIPSAAALYGFIGSLPRQFCRIALLCCGSDIGLLCVLLLNLFRSTRQTEYICIELFPLQKSRKMAYHFMKILVASLFILSYAQRQNVTDTNKVDPARPKNFEYLRHLITFDSTSWTYSASFIIDKTGRELTFLRYGVDSARNIYSEVRYSCQDYNSKTFAKTTLKNEIPYIKMLWESLASKVKIDLSVGFIGNPEEYEDVLKTYLDVFAKSTRLTYKFQGELNSGYNTDLYKQTLRRGNIYQPFDSLLKTYGFTISDYYPSEHDFFYSKAFLKQHGYDSTLIIPRDFALKIKTFHQ